MDHCSLNSECAGIRGHVTLWQWQLSACIKLGLIASPSCTRRRVHSCLILITLLASVARTVFHHIKAPHHHYRTNPCHCCLNQEMSWLRHIMRWGQTSLVTIWGLVTGEYPGVGCDLVSVWPETGLYWPTLQSQPVSAVHSQHCTLGNPGVKRESGENSTLSSSKMIRWCHYYYYYV